MIAFLCMVNTWGPNIVFISFYDHRIRK